MCISNLFCNQTILLEHFHQNLLIMLNFCRPSISQLLCYYILFIHLSLHASGLVYASDLSTGLSSEIRLSESSIFPVQFDEQWTKSTAHQSSDSTFRDVSVEKIFVQNDDDMSRISGAHEPETSAETPTEQRGQAETTLMDSGRGWESWKSEVRGFITKATILLNLIILFAGISTNRLRHDQIENLKKKRLWRDDYLCYQFSLDEIRLATENFSNNLRVGGGGFGFVYKGKIDDGAKLVAVKRLKFESHQGEKEFLTEIQTLAKLRHDHVVSLIGFCNENGEMILVYEFMAGGTLSWHLYKESGSQVVLSWERRVEMAIDIAEGLLYLHTYGDKVIHRDFKSSNILLDENLVAKISDFGLSKMEPPNVSLSHYSTHVRGTHGYLDPEYRRTGRLTLKSDVYAFGVVLFELLCGREALSMKLEEEQRLLATWGPKCVREGKVHQIIDKKIISQISSSCLKKFSKIAVRCLHDIPEDRPSMGEVMEELRMSLALQKNPIPDDHLEEQEDLNAATIPTTSDPAAVVSSDVTTLFSSGTNGFETASTQAPPSEEEAKGFFSSFFNQLYASGIQNSGYRKKISNVRSRGEPESDQLNFPKLVEANSLASKGMLHGLAVPNGSIMSTLVPTINIQPGMFTKQVYRKRKFFFWEETRTITHGRDIHDMW